MTGTLAKALDSAEELSSALNKIEKYTSLAEVTAKVLIATFAFVALALFIDIVLMIQNFNSVNPALGTIRLSGSVVGGALLNAYSMTILLGVVAVYAFSVHESRKFMRGSRWNRSYFDREKGEGEIVRFITGIEWDDILVKLKRAKLSFLSYTLFTTGLNSFLMYLVLLFTFPIVGVLAFRLSVSSILTLTYDTVLVIIAVAIVLILSRNRLRNSVRELWEMDEILNQLRWFTDEFKRSGFQA